MTEQLTYLVRLHTASSNIEQPSHRLAIIRWKDKKNDDGTTVTKQPARCVSIPVVSLSLTPLCLQASMQEAFEEMQDKLIRSLIEASKETTFSLSLDEISPQAVADFAVAQNGPGKLSTKLLETWFDNNLSDNLTVTIANKLGLPDQPTEEDTVKVSKAVASFRTFITGLASPRANLAPDVVAQLQKATALVENGDDKILQTINRKLRAFSEPASKSLEFAL